MFSVGRVIAVPKASMRPRSQACFASLNTTKDENDHYSGIAYIRLDEGGRTLLVPIEPNPQSDSIDHGAPRIVAPCMQGSTHGRLILFG